MEKFKRVVFSVFAVSLLTLPLAGCGNDEPEKEKGTEENGVHKPDDDVQSTDEKKDDENM